MNAIAIKPKTVEIVPARMANFTTLTWRTNDDAFARRLRVVVNNTALLEVNGADYDALGQWTDDTIRDLILARFGLELPEANPA